MTSPHLQPLGRPVPLGWIPRPVERPSLMPAEYAEGRCRYANESPLGVMFCRQSNEAGVPGDMQYFDPQGPTWDNAYDAALHMAKLHREVDQAGKATDQSFAVPLAVTDDPSAFARVYVLGAADEPLSLHDQPSSSHLYSLTRRWTSKP